MIISALLHFILKRSSINYSILDRLENIKNIFEFLFEFMMALLLLYIFNPLSPKEINHETRLLLFLLGVILLITANYTIFFKETKNTKLFEKIQKLFRK
jgi:drug/metabolite transporter (DMT)-like permease